MKSSWWTMRLLLLAAFLLSAGTTFVCGIGYFGAPFQQTETREELLRSQRTGQPLTNAEIANHVGRIGGVGRIMGVVGVATGLTGVIVVAAMILVTRLESER